MEYTLQIHFSVYTYIGLGNGKTYTGKMFTCYNFRIVDDPALLIVTADNIKFDLKIKNSEGGLISAEIKDDLTEGPWVFCLCGATKRGKSRSRTHLSVIIINRKGYFMWN
jgi:hypothetical protein